jgi:hypothetical protein
MTRKLPAPRQLAVTAVGGSLIFASVLLAPFAAGAPPCDRGDADGDGMSNLAECNFGTNPEEADSDHDNVSDPDEVHKHNTDPWKPDTDDDAISDWLEITGGTNPNVNDNAPGQGPGQGPDQVEECPGGAPDDCDADGMLNEDEINGWNSTGTPTDPKDPDSDNDDVNDGAEDDNGTNPQDPNDK